MNRIKSKLSYLTALLISLGTLGLVWALPVVDGQLRLVLFLAAVVVSSWVCGWRAGLLATAVCATASVLMQLTTEQDFMRESIRITAFLLLSLLILVLSVLRQDAEDSLSRSETQLRAILDNSRDPISVSRDGTHRFVNRAYLNLFGYKSADELIGKRVTDVIAADERATVIRRLEEHSASSAEPVQFETRGLDGSGGQIDLKVHVSSYDQSGEELMLVILRDISERNRTLREKEHLIDELQEALSKVNELRGLLPTCASCKKIRDEEGRWHAMETYICEHSEADFSHGLCPHCAERLYPEVFGPDSEEPTSEQSPEFRFARTVSRGKTK